MHDRIRAEPTHRLDNGFMKWCRAVTRGKTSDGTRRNAQIIDTKKGGENDERGNSQTR